MFLLHIFEINHGKEICQSKSNQNAENTCLHMFMYEIVTYVHCIQKMALFHPFEQDREA